MPQPPTDGILEEFRVEFLKCWERLPNKGFFLVLLAAWLALFQFLGNSTLGYVPTSSLLKWMYLVYQPGPDAAASDDTHGLIIPFVVLGLFWWKRNELLGLSLRAWWPGVLIVALGVALHIMGYVAQQPKVSIVGLFTGLYGLMGLAWGPAWLRGSLFPFFLFAFSIPFGLMAEKITFPLRLLVCQLVEFICHYILAIDVVRVGTSLRDPTGQYQYEVAAACSGMRSLISILLLATAFAFIAFRPYWKRAVLMASAIPLAVLGNLVRMMLIVIAAEVGGQKWGSWVHENSYMSLIPYVPAIAGLFALGWLLENRGRRDQKIA